MNQEQFPQRLSVAEQLKKYKDDIDDSPVHAVPSAVADSIPKPNAFNQHDFEKVMSKETDPDLMTTYEVVKLPSKGLFYSNGLSEVNVEYMTSKDEDLLTTPTLIENGTVLDILLKRKIKSGGVKVEDLLPGDRNAIILFLRTSSYGNEYAVQVTDPRTGTPFKTKVDLLKLQYKKMTELPDEQGHFSVFLPMRKKNAKIRLLTSGEDSMIFKKAEALKEAYGENYSQYSTLKLKAHVVSIEDNFDRIYIDKFIDAMPALDAFTIRNKILNVSPDVDMLYEFSTSDGYTFNANLSIGIDFFFPVS